MINHGYQAGYRHGMEAAIEIIKQRGRSGASHPASRHEAEALANETDKLPPAATLETELLPVRLEQLPPAVEILRRMIPGPTGMAIDGASRILLLRVNGNEYDTGVLALLERVNQLEAELREANEAFAQLMR